jgi:hypothetical protein
MLDRKVSSHVSKADVSQREGPAGSRRWTFAQRAGVASEIWSNRLDKSMNLKTILGAAAITTFVFGIALPAAADQHVKVGALRCEVSAGLGLIITSSKDLSCAFTSMRGWREQYYGKIHKFGLDLGATDGGVLAWDVFAPVEGPRRHALAGEYGGVDASATVGVGVGANVLVGGSGRAFTLQPLSVEGQTGLALAAGVESLTLRPGR